MADNMKARISNVKDLVEQQKELNSLLKSTQLRWVLVEYDDENGSDSFNGVIDAIQRRIDAAESLIADYIK